MKGKDSYGLFEIFKPGYMEGGFFRKFKYWFTSVFWCHFRYHALFFLIAAVLLVWLIVDLSTPKTRDIDYVLAGEKLVLAEQMDALNEQLVSVIEDVDGNGEITIDQQILCTMQSDTSDLAYVNGQKLAVTFAEDNIVLYVLDRPLMEIYAAEGAFAPLADFGIDAGDNIYYVRVDENRAFRESGIPAGDGWYMALKVVNNDRVKNEVVQKKYKEAAKIIEYCMQP